jgi:hypothetical protein
LAHPRWPGARPRARTHHATPRGECRPIGVPITFFLTGVFDFDALVSETASLESETRCAVEQVLEAPADSWGSLAYTICGGGNDPALCGAQATRLCSVNLILQWASVRTESVSVSDSTFGFTYTLAPQDERARTALYERGLQELDTLIAESAAIIDEYSNGTRNCSNENYDEIRATAARAEEL